MVLFQLLSTVVVLGFEQLVQWEYGPMGMVCLCLLAVGMRMRNSTCVSLGAVVFVLLMVQA
ncbi:hypothetical protein [Streptomyces jeddahensis]|uniref:Uncharacterized protein n=1 Tax=Streptomyces jeddahensis TaxID=1716141 RepID=A0A177HS55_9ACTN|nr:hypothetical protein [Streptomyces jeddahensis]OAH13287.1 hypothetical protein STSP_33220 [Streptomyces jeddahensis]